MTNPMPTSDSVRELPLGPDGDVEILLPSGDIHLRGVAGDRVAVRARGGRDIDEEVAIDASPGRVRIRDVETGYRLGPLRVRAHRAASLDIDIPRDARVSLRTLSGDVEATGIAADSRWATTSGDLRLAVDGGAVVIESMSGDVTLTATAAIGITARSVSGNLRLRAPLIERLLASTTSGDVRIEASLGAAGSHDVSSVSGDVELATSSPVRLETRTIAGDIRGSGAHTAEGGGGRRTLVIGNGTVRVAIRTTSGDIRLRAGAAGDEPVRGDDVEIEPPIVATERPTPPAAAQPANSPAPSAPATSVEPPTLVAQAEAAPNLVRGAVSAADRREAARLEVLRALERGELDVEAAARRLEILEEAGPRSFRGWC